jgi:cytochrome c
MFTRSIFAVLAFMLVMGTASGETPNLGKPITEAEIAPWDISIMPDGTGLPVGSGTPAQGAAIFAERCAACHGEGGKGTEFGAP